jgi:hypothetical protein
MKGIAFLLTIILSLFVFAAATQNSGGGLPDTRCCRRLTRSPTDTWLRSDKQVGLSAEPKPQLRAAFLQEAKYLFAVFSDQSMSLEQAQAPIQQLHVATQSNVWGLLTHEQGSS